MTKTDKGVSLVVVFLSVIIIAIIGLFVYQQFFAQEEPKEIINFSRFGNIIMNNPGIEQGFWHLVYEAPGMPANNIKLIFDDKSICNNEINSCSDLIQGQKVNIKGIEGDESVLVRELSIINEDMFNSLNSPIGLDWDLAVSFLNDCEVKDVFQENKDVYLTLKDDREFFTVKPDDYSLDSLIKNLKEKCGNINLISK